MCFPQMFFFPDLSHNSLTPHYAFVFFIAFLFIGIYLIHFLFAHFCSCWYCSDFCFSHMYSAALFLVSFFLNNLVFYLPKASCCRHWGPKTSRRDGGGGGVTLPPRCCLPHPASCRRWESRESVPLHHQVSQLCVCVNRSVVSDSCDPMDCSPPGSSVQGILQARVLERVAISFSVFLVSLPHM